MSEKQRQKILGMTEYWASDRILYNYPCDGCGKPKATVKLSGLAHVVLCQDCKTKLDSYKRRL